MAIPTYEEQVAGINKVSDTLTSRKDKDLAISFLKKPDAGGNVITPEGLAGATPMKEITPVIIPPISPTITEPEKTPQEMAAETAKTEKKTAVEDISKSIFNIGEVAGKEAGYVTELGGDIAQKEVTKYKADLAAEERAFETQRRALELNPQGMSTGALAATISRLEGQSLQKQADIAILGNAAIGRYNDALSIAQRKVESELAPLKTALDAKKFVFESNMDSWTTAEKAVINKNLLDEQRAYDDAKSQKTTIENIKIEAIKNGLKDLSGFADVTTVDGALKAAGSYLVSPNTETIQLDNGNVVIWDKRQNKIIKTLYGAKKETTDTITGNASNFNSVINQTSSFGGTNQDRDNIKNNLTNYLNSQNYNAAYTEIKNNVGKGLTGTTKTRFEDASIDSAVLKGLREKLVDFNEAAEISGTPTTGLLSGTQDSIIRKLGEVKDPALASLAIGLKDEFVKFRADVTGAAFSPGESRDYDSIRPSSKKSIDLNLALIDGLTSTLDNRVNTTVDLKVNGASEIRNLINKKTESSNNVFLQSQKPTNMSVFNSSTGWVIPGITQ